LRIIYLVGDAPPHMDYDNDVPYEQSCLAACQRGIIINTIQCGNEPSTTPIWQEIAQKSEGRFVRIAQDGGVQAVSTPFDTKLAELNAKLAQSAVVYGDAPTQTAANVKMQMAATQQPVTFNFYTAIDRTCTTGIPASAPPMACAPPTASLGAS